MRQTLASFLLALTCSAALGADSLQQSFAVPPDSTKPYMYWYWLNNNASAKGITADLEAMRQAGVGEVFIGHVVSDGIPEGSVPILSPEWWQLVSHAVREGDRIGVRVGMFNGPGWSQSGGPWMKPEQSMRYLVSEETRVAGGEAFRGVPAKHAKAIQDVAVIAYPVPAQDSGTVRPSRVACSAPVAGIGSLLTAGTPACPLPSAPLSLDLVFDKPVRLQTLTIDFGNSPVRLSGVLENVQNGTAVKVRDIALFRTNLSTAMGPLVTAPFVFAFAPTETGHLRLTFTALSGKPVAHAITFSSAARIDFAAEKQLGRMYPEPVPPPNAFTWPRQPEPAAGTAVDAERIFDLTSKVAKDGSLAWQAPAGGDWVIARVGMASTGVMCGPTPPQAQGLECDKMSRAAVDTHFDGMIGEFLRRIPADQRKGFQHITLDSYEVGPQNWTDGMTKTFTKTYGYAPTPWLACLSGRVVGSRDQTDRFLWDWRRLVADLIARNYVGGLKAAANRHGLKTWLENYGHWGFPGESLQYGGASDDIGGEYWLWNTLGDVECRLATSCAHIYGKKVVSAESFTSGKNFVQTPANMKTRGDWCMAQGINHFVLHVYTHQPYDAAPGIVPWFGTDFNRNSTWFKAYGKGWTDYLRRCCFLLQQGTHEADVAYFFGEDTPRMNGLQEPPLPPGYDFDYINAEVLLTRAACKNGRLTLPDGQSYRVLVLPPSETMTPRVLKKIEAFVKQGLTLVGNPPQRSPSLARYPDCDKDVLEAAQTLWGNTAAPVVDRAVRKGRVFRGHTLDQVFSKLSVPADVACASKDLLWIHRTGKDGEIYFVSNQTEKPIAVSPEFRVTGKQPELWDAVSGTTREPALFESLPHATRVPLRLDPAGSVFVLFRKPLAAGRVRVRSLSRDGETLVSCEKDATPAEAAAQPGSFALSALVTPEKDIPLPPQGPAGVHNKGQNYVVLPAHGKPWGDGHSGAGLSVGKNGVAAFEHWHNNIAPVLVWQAPAPLDKPVHVALVYAAGVPSLFIDGKKVHAGVASGQTAHPSPVGGGDAFAGTCDSVTRQAGTFTEADLAAAAKQAHASLFVRDRPYPSVSFAPDGALTLAASASGRYEALLSDGTTRAWQLPDAPFSLSLDHTIWTVAFQQSPGDTPRAVIFSALSDWKDADEPYVKYFSGTAVYSGHFCWGKPRLDARVWLDLGEVRNIAAVTLNGRDFGTVWKKPFRVDLSDALRAGDNLLEIRVANDWFNRLIGDEQFADDTGADAKGSLVTWPEWVLKGTQRPELKRVTVTSRKQVAKDTPLHSSGLLGPVTVFEELSVR
jgi:hypothetical protein